MVRTIGIPGEKKKDDIQLNFEIMASLEYHRP